MNYLNTCFYDKYDGHFYEYLAHVDFEFDKLLPEYGEVSDQEERLLDKFPNLRKVVDDREENMLSMEEVKALIEILDIRDEKDAMLKRQMFFKGYKEAYYFFNKIGVLNTERNEKRQC